MTHPFRRRGDSFASDHERARHQAVERLDGGLDPDAGRWLETHLDGCAACRGVADQYERDRLELRALRNQPIEAPRDLWARTAAAIEQEAARSRPGTRAGGRGRWPLMPLGAASGVLAVVVVVVGASLLSGNRINDNVNPSGTPDVALASTPAPTLGTPAPTSLTLTAKVDYVTVDEGGQVQFYKVNVSEVCPDNGSQCAPPQELTSGAVQMDQAPGSILLSPDDKQVVVLESDTTGDGGSVVVVPVPTPVPSDSGSSPTPSATPTASPTPRLSASPSVSVEPSVSVAPTASVEPSASVDPSATPSISPLPGGAVAIAEDVVVVGATAAFSADGTRFAFSARPADAAQGPDIWVWTVGEATAVQVTSDHQSIFAGWLDGLILGSRPQPLDGEAPAESAQPSASAEPTASVDPSTSVSPVPTGGQQSTGVSFLIDPATGVQVQLPDPGLWRPTVDPTRTRAVYWAGSIRASDAGTDWLPDEGVLVVGPWPDAPALPVATPVPGAEGEPSGSIPPASATAGATAPLASQTGEPSASGPGVPTEILATGPITDWDARWDEDGTHLAVWIADKDDPSRGRLSLYVVDPVTGRFDPDNAPLRGRQALAGFSISGGRLAWATPANQDGKGSHVEVIGWTRDGLGKIETRPGDDLVVVIR